jgi:hypothetical protein
VVFSKYFNLGLGNPRSDICSFCEWRRNKVKSTVNKKGKQKAITKNKRHVLISNKFYELLCKEEECFDMQQNQPLAKLNTGEVYYSRQIWICNLTVMVHVGSQSNEDISVYTWCENETGSSSDEVCSTLVNYLQTSEKHINEPATEKPSYILKLFPDVCSSQNKNMTITGALLNCVQESTIFCKIVYVFPVQGHSYMPQINCLGEWNKSLTTEEKLF